MDIAIFEKRLRAELDTVVTSLVQAADSAATVELDQSSIGRVSRIDAIQKNIGGHVSHCNIQINMGRDEHMHYQCGQTRWIQSPTGRFSFS